MSGVSTKSLSVALSPALPIRACAQLSGNAALTTNDKFGDVNQVPTDRHAQ